MHAIVGLIGNRRVIVCLSISTQPGLITKTDLIIWRNNNLIYLDLLTFCNNFLYGNITTVTDCKLYNSCFLKKKKSACLVQFLISMKHFGLNYVNISRNL